MGSINRLQSTTNQALSQKVFITSQEAPSQDQQAKQATQKAGVLWAKGCQGRNKQTHETYMLVAVFCERVYLGVYMTFQVFSRVRPSIRMSTCSIVAYHESASQQAS